MSKDYTVVSQQGQVIIKGGVPLNGYVIRVLLHEFDEHIHVEVSKLDPALIDADIRALLEKRRMLAKLGDTL